MKTPPFARLTNATLCTACLGGNATYMLRANAEAYGELRFSIRHCSGFSLEHRTVPFTMASVLTRLTVKTSALVTPRPRLTLCKLVSRNASAQSASKFQNNNHRRVLTLVGGSIVSIAALGAFIKFRSTANKANAMRKKSLVK